MPNVIKSVNSFSRNYDGERTTVRKTIAKLSLLNLTALHSVECVVVKALFNEVGVAFSSQSVNFCIEAWRVKSSGVGRQYAHTYVAILRR